MPFAEICHHLIAIWINKNRYLTPPEFEALTATLDRFLPLLTKKELDHFPNAATWLQLSGS